MSDMLSGRNIKQLYTWLTLVVMSLLLISCATPPSKTSPKTVEATLTSEQVVYQHTLIPSSTFNLSTYSPQKYNPTAIDSWFPFLQHTPVPWTTPLPDPVHSALDGIYGKSDPTDPQWWNCRRCPDYYPAGGNWRLQLDKGIFRIYYEVTGWRSLGSFFVENDTITFFNDPYCPHDIGRYRWKLEESQLAFLEIDDSCSLNLRAENLTRQPWTSCQPPNREAAISDHWIKPSGCER